MGEIAFAALLGAGSALISVWVDFRLGSQRPETLQRRFLHAVLAFGLLQVSVAVAGRWAGAGATTEQRMSATFLLLLPSLVYAFLAVLWLMRALADGATARR